MVQFCNNQLQTAFHEFQTISYNMFFQKRPYKNEFASCKQFKKVKSYTTKTIKNKVCADSGKEINK